MKRRAIFLDRDGTLNRDVGYAHRVQDIELLDHVVAGLTRLTAMGFQLIIATNQSGIARGYFSESDMHAFNQALREMLGAQGIVISAVYFCPDHPTAGIGRYRRESPLRKPASGMIAQAASEHDLDLKTCFAIGDKASDILAGQAAGCGTILVKTGAGGRGESELAATPDYIAADLQDAARWIATRQAAPSTASATTNASWS